MNMDERKLNGAESILVERRRQVEKELFDETHDSIPSGHVLGQLALAAACYAVNKGPLYAEVICSGFRGPDAWPWDSCYDKRQKHDRRRSLVIAGALIAAEIDRIDRRASASIGG